MLSLYPLVANITPFAALPHAQRGNRDCCELAGWLGAAYRSRNHAGCSMGAVFYCLFAHTFDCREPHNSKEKLNLQYNILIIKNIYMMLRIVWLKKIFVKKTFAYNFCGSTIIFLDYLIHQANQYLATLSNYRTDYSNRCFCFLGGKTMIAAMHLNDGRTYLIVANHKKDAVERLKKRIGVHLSDVLAIDVLTMRNKVLMYQALDKGDGLALLQYPHPLL
jgi:hypothetical protein